MNIDPKNTTVIKCESCQSEKFKQIVFLRKASKLLTGQPTDSVIPIPTFACDECGNINKEFIPKI